MSQEFQFREWIRTQTGSYTFVEQDLDHFRLETSNAIAQINFYHIEGEEDVVEFRIDTVDTEDAKFFLHFHANHEEHAMELFAEMVQTLADLQNQVKKEILLCCSSGLTTSFFAEKLNETADELGYLYSFSAVSVNDVYEAGIGKAAILLAPQIRYMEKQLKDVMPESVILNISTKVFGTYDAVSCIQEVDQEIKRMKQTKEEKVLNKFQPEFGKVERVMIISAVVLNAKAKIFYRVYDKGVLEVNEVVLKQRMTLKDIEDIIDTQVCSCSGQLDVDRIGIAIPGIINDGVLLLRPTRNTDFTKGAHSFPIQQYFEDKYHVPVSVDNNTNAAVVGWVGQHDEYSNVILYSQPRGWIYGGQGIVVDGNIVKGRMNSAGEIKDVEDRFQYQTPLNFNPYNPNHMIQIIVNIILMDIAVLDPEVICLRSELTPDMDYVRQEVAKYIDEKRIPKLVYIDNYDELILLGELLFTLQYQPK